MGRFGLVAPPYGAPIGLTVAALGGWLVHRERTARDVAPV
jgi:hypothetical protein